MSINKAILIGHVGQEPKVNTFDNGKVCNFTLATTKKSFRAKDGTVVPEQTTWHNISCNNRLVDTIEKYVHKGDKLYVEGELSNRQYVKEGVTHTITEIKLQTMEMLSSKQTQQPAANPFQATPKPYVVDDNPPF